MKNKIVYIAGSDGSGKTTYLKEVEKELISKNHITNRIWLRSPKITSKPLMAYCRLIGLTKRETIDGIMFSRHDFYKSTFVSWLFPKLQLLDFKIKWYSERKKIKDNEVVLFDRFSLDTLADLMVDTHKLDLHKTNIGKSFVKLLPKNTKTIVLHVDENVIRSRKEDTVHDKTLALRVKVYSILSKDLGLKVIDNNREFLTVKNEIKNYLNE